MKLSDVLIALMVPLIWGMGLVIAKPAVDQFPPILLMALRFSVTALLLVWFVPVPKGMRKSLALVALIGSTIQYGLSYNGLKLLDASTTALIVQIETPFLLLISALWLGDKLSMRQLVGLAVAFVGMYILTGAPNLVDKWLGISLTIGGAFMWALGQALMRRLIQKQPNQLSGMATIAWVSVFAAPQLFVASFIMEDQHWHHISHAGFAIWGAVAYLGIVMTALGYTCWYHVLGRYPASKAAPYLLLLPVFSTLGGWLFLGEPINPHILIGGAVIVFGVALLTVQLSAANK